MGQKGVRDGDRDIFAKWQIWMAVNWCHLPFVLHHHGFDEMFSDNLPGIAGQIWFIHLCNWLAGRSSKFATLWTRFVIVDLTF